MKKNNIFKVVSITLIACVLLTWLLPASNFGDTGLVSEGRLPVGLFDFFLYLVQGVLANFGYVPIFILVVGGFYGVLYRTDGYRNLLDKIVTKYKGFEWVFLTIVMILFAVITSVSGLSLGLLMFFPLVITTMLLMGYSKMTTVLATVGSVCIGLIGTTYSIADTELINSYLKLSASSEIISKVVLLVIGLVVLIFNTLLYARKHKIDQARAGFLYPESQNPKAKSWPIAVVFDIIFIIMILSFIRWTDVFEITFFEEALKAMNNFKIGSVEIFAKIFGTVNAFGSWGLSEITIVILISTMFIAFLSKKSIDETIEGFGEGAKRAAGPALIATMVYVLVFVCFYHPVVITIIKPVLELTKGFNVVTMAIATFVSSVLNVELYYAGGSIIGYVASVITDSSVYGLIALIFQAMYGFAMLFVPTSIVLVVTLSYLKLSYLKWLKAIWKMLLELLVILLIFFLIIFMI